MLTATGMRLDDLGLDAATKARYWMTFFVFSVLPAPDSPVHRILWSSRSKPKYKLRGSASDPDPLDPQHFSFLDPGPQKYVDPQIWIQGAKYQQQKSFALKTQIWNVEKIKNIYFLISVEEVHQVLAKKWEKKEQ